jgi:hypothetical protein
MERVIKIQHTFYSDVDIKNLEDGRISYIDFDRLKPYLIQAFGIKPYERLSGITVTESGIKAKIELIK